MIPDLICITIILVIIIDYLPVIRDFKSWIKRRLKIKGELSIKPFECSLCMTHWIGLIYLIISGELSLGTYLFLLLLSILTPLIGDVIGETINLLRTIIFKIFNYGERRY